MNVSIRAKKGVGKCSVPKATRLSNLKASRQLAIKLARQQT